MDNWEKTVGYQTDVTKLFEPERTHNTDNDDDEYDDNGGDGDNGQNLFGMASTLRTWRKSPLLWSMFPPGDDHTMVIIYIFSMIIYFH